MQQVQDQEEPARKKRETADGHALAIKNADAEPEAEEAPNSQNDKATTAQQVHRVKREPHSVLSKKKRRAQRKLEQKASAEKQQQQQAEQEEEQSVQAEVEPVVKKKEESEEEVATSTETTAPELSHLAKRKEKTMARGTRNEAL